MLKLRIRAKLLGVLAMLLCGSAVALADTRLPREVRINATEFVLIPAGWFYKTGGVATPDNDEGGGNARIWLDDFYIGKYEARARDLVAYLNLPRPEMPDYFGKTESCSVRLADTRYELIRADEDLPATHLSWNLAKAMTVWMGFRLPSEAEWEKAARGEDQRIYPWGDEFPDETRANFMQSSNCLVWPVNRLAKGVSAYGVYNMAGNVREFVEDWHNKEADSRLKDGVRNPPLATHSDRRNGDNEARKIIKGGRWGSFADQIRIFERTRYPVDKGFQCNGTRYALDIDKVREHLAKGTAEVIAW